MDLFDIIIVGAGTAGMTSALYSLRNGKSVLVLEGDTLGGQIAFSPKVENYPTHKSVSGAELADMLYEQITELGAQIELEKVVATTKREDGLFSVVTEYNQYLAKSVILATGVKHRNIGVEGVPCVIQPYQSTHHFSGTDLHRFIPDNDGISG